MSAQLDKSPESQPNRRLQFQLKTALILVTLLCIWLAVCRSWPERAFLGGVLIVAAIERLYRHRIKDTLGAERYERLGSILTYAFGAAGGTVVGELFAVLLLFILQLNADLFDSVKLGAACGLVMGLIYPRLFTNLLNLLSIFGG